MPTLSSLLPTGGLFLPETAHRANGSLSAEGEATRPKYFQRKSGRPKQEPQDSEDRPSTAIPRESLDTFASLPTAFCFADYVFTTDKASSDTLSFANLIHIVRKDTNEASRLYLSSSVSNFLDAYPDKRKWVETTLLEMRRALNDIGLEMDAAWGQEDDGGTVASKRKLEWGLRNQKKLVKKHEQLQSCHQNLTGAILVMQTAELCGKSSTVLKDPIFEAPVRPWVPLDEKDALRGPYSRQKWRASNTNLSASNATVSSEAENDDIDTRSVNSIPVELAGSTPDDLAITEPLNMNTMLRPQPSLDFPTNNSTLLRRPRARTDFVRANPLRDINTRALIDVVRTSSKATDSTIERNDSTMSTTATVSVPMVARRYRATSVDIQRQRDKHRSLPSELPHVKSQSSLADDLIDYMIPSAASEKAPSKEWAASPTMSVPSISVTSSPTTSQPLPVVPETTSVANRIVYKSTLQFAIEREDDDEQPPPLPPRPRPHNQGSAETVLLAASEEDLTSIYRTTSPQSCQSPSSLFNANTYAFTGVIPDDEPVRRPSSQRPSQRLAKRRSSHASSSRSCVAQPSPKITAIMEPQESGGEEDSQNASATAPSTPVIAIEEPSVRSTEDTNHDASISVDTTPATEPQPPSADATGASNQDSSISQTTPKVPITTESQLDPSNPEGNVCFSPPSPSPSALPQPTTNFASTQQPIIIETSQPLPATPTEPLQYDDTDEVLLARLRSRLRRQSNVLLMAEDLVRGQGEGREVQQEAEEEKKKNTEAENVVVREENDDVKVEGEEGGKEKEKGMSAQAKRRAAHKRRMMIAFGDARM